MGGEGEGSGVKGGGKWGERGREVGIGYPPVHPLNYTRNKKPSVQRSDFYLHPEFALFQYCIKPLNIDAA